MTTNHTDTEMVRSDSHLEPNRFRVTYQCERCRHVFKRTFRVVPKRDPACPNPACEAVAKADALQRENENLRRMLDEQRAPAHTGANNTVRAVDATADIVMKDYGMTDLQDGIRQGESVAPKLPPPQQAAADGYFGAQRAAQATDFATGHARTINKRQMDQLGRRAMAGAFRNMAVAPTAVVPGATKGQPAITLVGTRSNDMYVKKPG